MLAVILHTNCLEHDSGLYHPESPDRLHAINNQIIMSGLDFVIRRFGAPFASREQLTLAHDRTYVEHVFSVAPEEGSVGGHSNADIVTLTKPLTGAN